jgi:hypothetical protein
MSVSVEHNIVHLTIRVIFKTYMDECVLVLTSEGVENLYGYDNICS